MGPVPAGRTSFGMDFIAATRNGWVYTRPRKRILGLRAAFAPFPVFKEKRISLRGQGLPR